MELRSTSCCGLKEYEGLTDKPEQALETMCRYRYAHGWRSAFILFTDPVVCGRGILLKELIEKLKIGIVIETDAVVNPNTDKLLVAYIFTPNDKKLKKWYKDLVTSRPAKFKVGDRVIAIENNQYTITRNGWVGVCEEIESEDYMKVSGDEIMGNTSVLMEYFNKA